MNPARQENMPTGKIFFLPNKHWFPSGWITSMMTTGSENTHTDKQEKNCTYSISNKKKKKNYIFIYIYIYTPLFSQLIINKLVCKMSPLYKRVKIFKPLVLSDQNSKRFSLYYHRNRRLANVLIWAQASVISAYKNNYSVNGLIVSTPFWYKLDSHDISSHLCKRLSQKINAYVHWL